MITLEEVLSPENMQTACRRVIANKGAPGVDGMTVNEVRAHFEKHGASICAHIREGRYIPAAVKRVDIPKPNGGTRMLGIPTVQDRVIQQAIAQVLSKHFDPLFSEFSWIPPWKECPPGHRADPEIHRRRANVGCGTGLGQILRYG